MDNCPYNPNDKFDKDRLLKKIYIKLGSIKSGNNSKLLKCELKKMLIDAEHMGYLNKDQMKMIKNILSQL